MVRAPQFVALPAQGFLVEFADLFENLPHTIEVLQLPANVRDLLGMEAELAVPGAWVVDVKDPLEMALAAGAGSAGNRSGVESMAFQERAAEERIEGRKRSQEFGNALRRLLPPLTCHLSRGYTRRKLFL